MQEKQNMVADYFYELFLKSLCSFRVDFEPFFWLVSARNSCIPIGNKELELFMFYIFYVFRFCLTCSSKASLARMLMSLRTG